MLILRSIFGRPCAGPCCKSRGVFREDFEAYLCDIHAGRPSYLPANHSAQVVPFRRAA